MVWSSLSIFRPKSRPLCRGRLCVRDTLQALLDDVPAGAIAVLREPDLTAEAAQRLIDREVKAALVLGPAVSPGCPAPGPLLLLQRDVPLWEAPADTAALLADGAEAELWAETAVVVIGAQRYVVSCEPFSREAWLLRQQEAQPGQGEGAAAEPAAEAKRVQGGGPAAPPAAGAKRAQGRGPASAEEPHAEAAQGRGPAFADAEPLPAAEAPLAAQLARALAACGGLLAPLPPLALQTRLAGRPVVVAGSGCDAAAVTAYARERRTLVVAAAGCAMRLVDAGCRPDLIVGDLANAPERALRCGAELVAQVPPGGPAQLPERLAALGLSAHVLPCGGTDEDAALLLAYEQQAAWIIAAGTAPPDTDADGALLVRWRLGPRLLELEGVRQLAVRAGTRRKDALQTLCAALIYTALGLLQMQWIAQRIVRYVWGPSGGGFG